MATWGDTQLVDKRAMQPKGDMFYVLSETPCGNRNLTGSLQITPSLLSTLISAAHIQRTMDLGRLQQELKNIRKDLDGFQQKATENLERMEGKLHYLMDVVSGLENRSHDMEQRLMAEEDRGIARSQVLSFLLSREKGLREKCGVLEKVLFKKNTWQKERLKNAVLSNREPTPLKIAQSCTEKRQNGATPRD